MSEPLPVPGASNTFERIKQVESPEKKRLQAGQKKALPAPPAMEES